MSHLIDKFDRLTDCAIDCLTDSLIDPGKTSKPRLLMLGGLREIGDGEFGERGGEGSRQAAERGAGPVELIGLDKKWGGREGRYQFYQLLPTAAPIIVIPPRANSADRAIRWISGPTSHFLRGHTDINVKHG